MSEVREYSNLQRSHSSGTLSSLYSEYFLTSLLGVLSHLSTRSTLSPLYSEYFLTSLLEYSRYSTPVLY